MCVELGQLAERVVIGDGMNETTQMGPLQNIEQYAKVQSLLADSKRIGARIVAGGVLPSRPGYFMPPTVVSEISDGARLVDEEQFGPILPVIRYSDTEEVLRRANGTPFGLGASVWTSNSERGAELAARMEAGTVWVNQHGPLGPDIPFGGIKQSGIGVIFSKLGLEEFTRIQIIRVATN
jgi:acyl-CoA reductase-like NAD-dependent aldehyde dehydrogenase